MEKFLTKPEIAELREEHRLERNSRYADRIKAILLLNSGHTPAKVAEYLLMDEKTVRKFFRMYEEGGLEELCMDEYRGGVSYLSIEQQDELERELREKIYPTA